MLHSVDAEPVEVRMLDPAREDVDHGRSHLGDLRRDVLQPSRKVTEHRLRLHRVVEDAPEAVVRPRRGKDARLRGFAVHRGILDEDDRRPPCTARGAEGLHSTRVPVGVVLRDPRNGRSRSVARDVDVGLAVEIHVVKEDLPHVVHDDVQDHLEPLVVGASDHRAQRREVSEVRIRLRQVLRPVPVVGVHVGVGVDVLDDGRDPERRDPESGEVVEVVLDALPVPTLVLRESTGLDCEVVVDVPIGEAVDQHLVDDLIAPILDVGGKHRGLAGVGHRHAPETGCHPRREDQRHHPAGTNGSLLHRGTSLPHGYELELNHHSTPSPTKCSTLRWAKTSSLG